MSILNVLYVDDLKSSLVAVKSELEGFTSDLQDKFKVTTYSSIAEFRENIHSISDLNLALLDIRMHDDNCAGLTLAKETRHAFPNAIIIMFSQFDDADTILQYMIAGADDFLSKEIVLEDLPSQLHSCYKRACEKRDVESFDSDSITLKHTTFIGKTMVSIAKKMPSLINSSIKTIHITGETGTGKEVVAKILHSCIGNTMPFVSVNCGALSPSLLESQLFGHAKGAFTGAVTAKAGLFEAASGGWLFLDEVAELTSAAQVALLRVIEEQIVVRLGETSPQKVNVRIISATNENLERRVHEGKFRLDLLERLSGHTIVLPPIRDRKDEIEPLANYFISKVISNGPYILPRTSLEILQKYNWPGNIRELLNCLIDMSTFHVNKILNPSSIPRKIYQKISTNQYQFTKKEDEIILSVDWNNFSFIDLQERLLAAVVTNLINKRSIYSKKDLSSMLSIPLEQLETEINKLEQEGKIFLSFKANL